MTRNESAEISFNTELDIDELPEEDSLIEWLLAVSDEEEKTIGALSYLFVSDDELLELNKQYLDHDTYTDILTFPYSYDPIHSDICISIDRVRENAADQEISPLTELLRVIVHGLLHMCGYTDETTSEKLTMRQKEDYYLMKWK